MFSLLTVTSDPEFEEPELHPARAIALNAKTAVKARTNGYFKIFCMIVLSILIDVIRLDEMTTSKR